jgi:hypothetical protein
MPIWIFRRRGEELTWGWKILQNEQFHHLYFSGDINEMMKWWSACGMHSEYEQVYLKKVEYILNTDMCGIMVLNWVLISRVRGCGLIRHFQNRIQWQPLTNTVMNLHDLWETMNFFTRCATTSFTRKTLLHRINRSRYISDKSCKKALDGGEVSFTPRSL